MGDLRIELARLRKLTPELNAATDRATKVVLAVEKFLNEECQLGIPSYAQYNEWDDGRGTSSGMRLEYARHEGTFRVLITEFTEYPDGDFVIREKQPWVNCTRHRKLESVHLIPRLLDSIAKRVRSTITDANENADKVEGYLVDLGVIKEGK